MIQALFGHLKNTRVLKFSNFQTSAAKIEEGCVAEAEEMGTLLLVLEKEVQDKLLVDFW